MEKIQFHDDIIKGMHFIDYFRMMRSKADFVLAFDAAGRFYGYTFDVIPPIDVYVEKISAELEREGVFQQHVVRSFGDIPIVIENGFRITSEEKTLVDMFQKNGMYGYDMYRAFDTYYGDHGSFDKVEVPKELKKDFDRCVADTISEW